MPRLRNIIAALSTVVVLAMASGCASDDALSGRVVDDTVTLAAPSLAVPMADLDAGFAPQATPGQPVVAGGASRSSLSTAAALAGLGQYSRIATVTVTEGDTVRAGDIIAVFDTAALAADVQAARAAQATAKAQLPVIDDALDDVASGRSTVRSNRATLVSTIARAKETRADLVAKRAQLTALLAQLPPSIPPTLPPGVPRPPDPATVKAAIAQLDAGIAKIDAGLKKAGAGFGKLDSASSKLSDARTQLDNARELAKIAAEGAKVGVSVARWRLSVATVRAPESGTVVEVASAGDAMAPGATVAVIRRDRPARVTTWVTPEQLAAVQQSGSSSSTWAQRSWSVSGDWARGRSYPATLVRVGSFAQYPPTSFSTRVVHLTRAIEIELEVDSSATPPAGASADVRMK